MPTPRKARPKDKMGVTPYSAISKISFLINPTTPPVLKPYTK